MDRVGTMGFGIIIIVYPLLLVIPVLLQIYLSKRENKYLGWILPIIFFLSGSFLFLNIAQMGPENLMNVIIASIIFYFPTVLMIGIYKFIRKNYKNKSEIDKMNIQDL